MLTTLLALHCMGAGGTFVYLGLSNMLTKTLGSSRGMFSMPLIVLLSMGWEIYWGGVLLSIAKEKYMRSVG